MNLPLAQPRCHRPTATTPRAQAWLLPLDEWRPQGSRLASLLSPAQRQRFSTIRDPARRNDRLLAAALHRWVLSQALAMAPGHLPL
jgi:hypothetical protein